MGKEKEGGRMMIGERERGKEGKAEGEGRRQWGCVLQGRGATIYAGQLSRATKCGKP